MGNFSQAPYPPFKRSGTTISPRTAGDTLALGASNITVTGSLAATGARVLKGWFTDLECTNAIVGSITGASTSCSGNSATVTTNANLTGIVTSVGNATAIAAGALTADKLQNAAADLGGADVNINLGNTNGAFVTNLTIDGQFNGSGAGLTGTAASLTAGTCSGNAATVTKGVYTDSSRTLPYTAIADGTDGNLITWDSDGHVALVATGNATQVLTSNGAGAAPTFQDASGGGTLILTLPAAAGWSSVTSPCTGPVQAETTNNDVNYFYLEFADAATSYAEFGVVLPDNFTLASTVTAKFFWAANSADGNDVVWGIQGVSFVDSLGLDAQAYGTEKTVTDTNQAQLDMNVSGATTAITIAGTPGPGVYTQFRVYRKGADGSDTLAAAARLIAVQITYA